MSDSKIFQNIFAPCMASFTQKLVSHFAGKVPNVDALIVEDELCGLFMECVLGEKVVYQKPVPAPKATKAVKGEEEKKEPKGRNASKPLCSYPDCPVHVMKTERLVEGKVYCSKHFKKMENEVKKRNKAAEEEEGKVESKAAKPAKPAKAPKAAKADKKEEEKAPVKVEIKQEAFDFANEEPRDFIKEDTFWKFSPYGDAASKLLINPRTQLVFTKDQVIMSKVSPFVGLLVKGQVVLAKDLEPHIIDWVKACNIKVATAVTAKQPAKVVEQDEEEETEEYYDEHDGQTESDEEISLE